MPKEERTEKATPKKREDVRKKEGMVAHSAELNSAVLLMSSILIIRYWAPAVFKSFIKLVEKGMSTTSWARDPIETTVAIKAGIVEIISQFAPLALPLFVLAVMVNALQVKFYFVPKTLSFKGERINPLKGLKRIFSARTLVELLKNILKVTIVAAVAFYSIRSGYVSLHRMTGASASEMFSTFLKLVFSTSAKVAMVLLLLGGADYCYRKWEFERSIRMTRQEIKEEIKQTEGDPQLRAMIRQRMRQLTRQRMMQRLRQATLVVTNPTHYAVALLYHRGMRAPRVVAKGVDYMALRIRDEAERLGIPLVEEPQLARDLYRMVDLENEIPPQLYRAVAEVIAYLMRLDRRIAARIA